MKLEAYLDNLETRGVHHLPHLNPAEVGVDMDPFHPLDTCSLYAPGLYVARSKFLLFIGQSFGFISPTKFHIS